MELGALQPADSSRSAMHRRRLPIGCAQVLVEFATNDLKDTGVFKSQERLAFERLLRKLLGFPQRSVRLGAGVPVQGTVRCQTLTVIN